MLDSAKNMKKYVQILAWTNTRHRIPNIPRTKAKTDIPTLLHVSKASHNGVKTFLEFRCYRLLKLKGNGVITHTKLKYSEQKKSHPFH